MRRRMRRRKGILLVEGQEQEDRLAMGHDPTLAEARVGALLARGLLRCKVCSCVDVELCISA